MVSNKEGEKERMYILEAASEKGSNEERERERKYALEVASDEGREKVHT